jgi:hypothetical protein
MAVDNPVGQNLICRPPFSQKSQKKGLLLGLLQEG